MPGPVTEGAIVTDCYSKKHARRAGESAGAYWYRLAYAVRDINETLRLHEAGSPYYVRLYAELDAVRDAQGKCRVRVNGVAGA